MPKQQRSAKTALIGNVLEVLDSKNPTLKGVRGRIIDETRNTITIQTDKGTKKIVKEQVVLKVQDKTIDGTRLIGKIHERIKQ